MLARSTIRRVLIAITIAVFGVAIGLFAYQIRRARLTEAILTKVDRLTLQPPDGISELEWAAHVYWTHNLHCAAIPQIHASVSSLRELDRFLDDANTGGPDRETIEILWDRYATMSQSGYRYRTKYEPVRDEIVDAIVREGDDYFDVRSYQDFLQYVRSTEPAENDRDRTKR